MTSLIHTLSEFDSIRLGWALIHFLWQGIALVFLLEVALALAGRNNASLRYLLCGLALAAMPVCLVDTYLALGQETFAAVSLPVSGGITMAQAASPKTAPTVFALLPAVHTITDFTSLQMFSFDWNRWLPGVVACWLAGIVVLAGRKAGGLIMLRRLRREGIETPTDAMCAICRRACGTIGVDPRRVYLGISTLIEVPMTMGWIRPVILFPASLLSGLNPEEIELLLAHELAHIRRCDYLVNLIQTVVETLFFYHPVTWWVSRRMRQERENCCDDLVAIRSTQVLAYAQVLYRLEAFRSPGISLAAAANGGSLLQRIQRLANEPAPRPAMGIPVLLTSLSLIGVITAGAIKLQAYPSNSKLTTNSKFIERSASKTLWSRSNQLVSVGPTVLYQDNFSRQGELDGTGPGVINAGCATWTSSTGANQYTARGNGAEMNSTAYAYSAAYLPVNGTSHVTLDGTKDFTLSVVVTPGASGRTGISLNTGTFCRYSNMFTHDFAALSTGTGFAGAYAFNGGDLGYNYGPGTKGPTTISIIYNASAGTLTYKVGTTTVHLQNGVTPDQVSAIRYVAMGNDGYGAFGAATPAPSFHNFSFTVANSIENSSATASLDTTEQNTQASL